MSEPRGWSAGTRRLYLTSQALTLVLGFGWTFVALLDGWWLIALLWLIPVLVWLGIPRDRRVEVLRSSGRVRG